jgi:hypothetical protein
MADGIGEAGDGDDEIGEKYATGELHRSSLREYPRPGG